MVFFLLPTTKHKAPLLLLCSLTLYTHYTHATPVYKYIDNQGNTHYSDEPSKKHSSTELDNDQKNFSITKLHKTVPTNNTDNQTQESNSTPPTLSSTPKLSATILYPSDEQTLQNPDSVTLAIQVTPKLPSNYKVRATLNQEQILESSTPSFELGRLHRGTHNVNVEIVNPQGITVQRTNSHSFTVLRPSIAR